MSPLQKTLGLDDDALARIAEAVRTAESATDGEIVVAAAKESSRYSFWELLTAVIVAVVAFAALLFCAPLVSAVLERHLWQVPLWYLPAFYGVAAFALIALVFQLTNIPAIDRLVIPRFVQQAAVSAQAFRLFAECGVHNTAHHSGVLVYISVLEQQVRILADSGISAKISPDLWALIADGLSDGLRSRNCEAAITGAVTQCGDLLARYFPAQKTEGDELPDGLVLIENAPWS